MTTIRRNDALVLPSGTRFQVAGGPVDRWMSLSIGALASSSFDESAIDVGSGLVRVPRGIYARLSQIAYDTDGTQYAVGTTLFVNPGSAVQPVVKMGRGKVYPVTRKGSGLDAGSGAAMLGAAIGAVVGMG